MANKQFRFGPAYLASTATNILSPGTLTGGVLNGSTFASGNYVNSYIILRALFLTNVTGGAVTATLYIGGTGGSTGGTEYLIKGFSIAANSMQPLYPGTRLDVADFLTGLASAGSSIVITGSGEIGVA